MSPARRPGHRSDPALYLEARLGRYSHEPGCEIKQLWQTARVRASLLPDGRVQFGKYWRRYAPTEVITEGWRQFTCTRTDTHNFYCEYEDRAQLREDDYQRLLGKAGDKYKNQYA